MIPQEYIQGFLLGCIFTFILFLIGAEVFKMGIDEGVKRVTVKAEAPR